METLLIKRLDKEQRASRPFVATASKQLKGAEGTHLGFIVNTSTDVWNTRVTGCH